MARTRRPERARPWDTAAMRRVEAEALVGARRDEVWQLYDAIEGTPRWVPFVDEIVYVSGPARVGCVYRERTRLPGIPAPDQGEIVRHRAARARGLDARAHRVVSGRPRRPGGSRRGEAGIRAAPGLTGATRPTRPRSRGRRRGADRDRRPPSSRGTRSPGASRRAGGTAAS